MAFDMMNRDKSGSMGHEGLTLGGFMMWDAVGANAKKMLSKSGTRGRVMSGTVSCLRIKKPSGR